MTDIGTMSLADAESRLGDLSIDPDWGRLLLAGDAATRAEFGQLTSRIAAGDAPPPGLPDAPSDGFVAVDAAVTRDLAAPLLASVGVVAAGEAITGLDSRTGKPFDDVTIATVKALRAQRESDPNWRRSLLAGDHVARRELRLMSIILMNEA